MPHVHLLFVLRLRTPPPRPHEEKVILQLIHMIVKDPVLIHKDNYVIMLTALR